VSKRTIAAVAVATGCVLGGVIGFAWHAPGRPVTWDDIRTWAAFAAVVVGVPVAIYQLYLQRRQLADQQAILEGEIERNKRRDQLLDGQLNELEQRSRVAERAQAEAIDVELVDSTDDPPIFMGNITNRSRRPIRDAICRITGADGPDDQVAGTIGVLADWKLGGQVARRIMVSNVEPGRNGCAPLIRVGGTMCFGFTCGRRDLPDAQAVARFTDDAGLHWEIGPDLHLRKLDSRGDW